MSKTTANRRSNGQFGKGNTIGTKFKPGNNANPNGRRGSLKDIIDQIGDELDHEGISKREKVMSKVWSMAIRGDMKAVQFLADRAEGRAKEYIEQKITKDRVIVE